MKNSFDDLLNYIDDVNNQNTLKKKAPNKVKTIIINILIITFLVGGGYGIKYIQNQEEDVENSKTRQQELLLNSQKQAAKLKETIMKKQEEAKMLSEELNKKNEYRDFDKLKEENSDTVAWLYVPGTDIDLPIVQAKDNSYYLSHNFDKEKNQMGWAFADYQNTFPNLSDNTIMYGHTYRQTTIFSKLKNVLNSNWLNDSTKHIITLDTEKERLTFKVFSIYTIKATNDYLYINFETKEAYQKYLDRERKRSIKNFKVNVTNKDKILTLSTCYKDANNRLIVHAKLIGAE